MEAFSKAIDWHKRVLVSARERESDRVRVCMCACVHVCVCACVRVYWSEHGCVYVGVLKLVSDKKEMGEIERICKCSERTFHFFSRGFPQDSSENRFFALIKIFSPVLKPARIVLSAESGCGTAGKAVTFSTALSTGDEVLSSDKDWPKFVRLDFCTIISYFLYNNV